MANEPGISTDIELPSTRMLGNAGSVAQPTEFIVKTDSLFYRLLQAEPPLAFDLAGVDVPQHEGYRFISQEIKQTAFRLDGIAEPPADSMANRPSCVEHC